MTDLSGMDEVQEFTDAFLRESAYIPYPDQPLPSRADRLGLAFFKKALRGGVHHQNEVMRRLERLPLHELARRFARWGTKDQSADTLRVGLGIAGLLAGRDHRGTSEIFKQYIEAARSIDRSPEQLFVDVACHLTPSAGEAMRAFIYHDGTMPPIEGQKVTPPADGQTYPLNNE